MNPDAQPPPAGEKTGVQPPAQIDSLPTTGTDPSAGLSAIAKRLREKIAENPGNDEAAFQTDIAAMRALFADLLHNTGKEVDLKFGLTVALRAQKQAFDAFVALRKLEVLESKQNPPGWITRIMTSRLNRKGPNRRGRRVLYYCHPERREGSPLKTDSSVASLLQNDKLCVFSAFSALLRLKTDAALDK